MTLAVLLGACVSTSAAAPNSWKSGDQLTAGFLCDNLSVLKLYAEAKPELARQYIIEGLKMRKCMQVPPGVTIELDEFMLEGTGIDNRGVPSEYQIWRVKGSEKKINVYVIVGKTKPSRIKPTNGRET